MCNQLCKYPVVYPDGKARVEINKRKYGGGGDTNAYSNDNIYYIKIMTDDKHNLHLSLGFPSGHLQHIFRSTIFLGVLGISALFLRRIISTWLYADSKSRV